MVKSQLYFIAIILPQEISTQIRNYQLDAARRFQSFKALNSPPHITLFPPFRWPASQMSDVSKTMKEVTVKLKPFTITLSGFGNFSPRVIYISVTPNSVLDTLYESLQEMFRTRLKLNIRKREVFHPHVTIAYKDLKRSCFREAWEFFRTERIETEIKIDRIWLLRHDGYIWRVGKDFRFNSDPNDNAHDRLF